jgi:outer membrane protein OmpA-like peptidoglycan-associated protein
MAAMTGPASAQTVQPPAPANSAQDLKAAIAEIKRRLEQQRQTVETPPASAATEDLRGARDRIENLARTMSELRGERDGLRGQLLQARDELQKVQQRLKEVEQARKDAAATASARIAGLERDLANAQARTRELEASGSTMASDAEAVRKVLAVRDQELAAAQQEMTRLRQDLAGRDAARDALTAKLDATKRRSGALDAELTRVRDEAAQGRADNERRLAGELDAVKARLAHTERESAELRAVATTSVEEVKALSDQLLAALSEKDQLVAATVELSSSKALQDLQLQASDEGVGRDGTVEPAVSTEPPPVATPIVARPEPPPVPTAWSRTTLDGNLFAVGSERLEPEAASALARIARLVREGDGPVRVIGHTDSNGEPDANRRLSLKRAQAVRDYLVGTFGFDRKRFEVDGRGEDEPTTSNDTPGGRRANRRVDVFVAR